MPYKNNSRKTSGKKTGAKKFSNDKFIMMQVGTQFLDDGDYGQKTRILFSDRNDEWSWCVREKNQVTHWFGVTKGRELLFRAIEAGQCLGTSAFFEKDDSLKGNPRINIKGVATDKELAAAKRAAEAEAWLDAEEDAEEDEDESEEEEEYERPPARKGKQTTRKPQARKYPDLEEATDEEETTDEDDVLPF